jgi:hypothetical protein
VEGIDYSSAFGSVTFPPGVTRRELLIPVIDNDTAELPRYFSISTENCSTNVVIEDDEKGPKLSGQAGDATCPLGNTVELLSGFSGPGLRYQWYRGANEKTGVPIPSATESSYFAPAMSTPQKYWCRAYNSHATVDTGLISVSAKPASMPKISSHPARKTINFNTDVLLSVKATGTNLTYQWYRGEAGKGVPIAGANLPNYRTELMRNADSFYVEVSNTLGLVRSNSALLTVKAAPPLAFKSHPKATRVIRGQVATLSVKASGWGLKYQWFEWPLTAAQPTEVPGGISASILTPAINEPTRFFCRVSQPDGRFLESNMASITVR